MEIDLLSALKATDPESKANVFEIRLNDSKFKCKINYILTGSKEAGMYFEITLENMEFDKVFDDLCSLLKASKQLKGFLYDGKLEITAQKEGDIDKLLIIFEEFDNTVNKLNLRRKVERDISRVNFTVVFN